MEPLKVVGYYTEPINRLLGSGEVSVCAHHCHMSSFNFRQMVPAADGSVMSLGTGLWYESGGGGSREGGWASGLQTVTVPLTSAVKQ